jgi:hypothetical protein
MYPEAHGPSSRITGLHMHALNDFGRTIQRMPILQLEEHATADEEAQEAGHWDGRGEARHLALTRARGGKPHHRDHKWRCVLYRMRPSLRKLRRDETLHGRLRVAQEDLYPIDIVFVLPSVIASSEGSEFESVSFDPASAFIVASLSGAATGRYIRNRRVVR